MAAVALLMALPAGAAELKLEFHAGRVTLIARDVSVRQILVEWAKIGGTEILNIDRISTATVTLQLEGVPERQALEAILRSAAGYVAAPRRPDHPGRSIYDRILVMAVSTPPPPPASSARPAPQPGFGPAQPGLGLPQPGFGPPQPGFGQPRDTPIPTPLFPPALNDDQDDNDDEEPNVVAPRPPGGSVPGMPSAAPAPSGAAPAAKVPGGTSVPGIVVPVPQPPAPGAPPSR